MIQKRAAIQTIILFCTAGIILLWGISFVIDHGVAHSDDAQTGKINKLMKHELDPTCLIFGSSVSEVGIASPLLQDALGISVYNASIDGTRFMQYRGLIHEFVSYSTKNQYVILVETYFSFEPEALNNLERYMVHLDKKGLYESLEPLQPGLVRKCRYVPFYKYVVASPVYYRNAIRGWRNIYKGIAEDSLHGFSPVNRSWELDADAALAATDTFNIRVDTEVLAKYKESIHLLQASGKKVILLLMPVYMPAMKRLTDFGPLRATLQQVATQYQVPFLDFSESDFSEQKQLFYNANHLNRQGAEQFTRALSDTLREIMK